LRERERERETMFDGLERKLAAFEEERQPRIATIVQFKNHFFEVSIKTLAP
jgi:hypothetical protein